RLRCVRSPCLDSAQTEAGPLPGGCQDDRHGIGASCEREPVGRMAGAVSEWRAGSRQRGMDGRRGAIAIDGGQSGARDALVCWRQCQRMFAVTTSKADAGADLLPTDVTVERMLAACPPAPEAETIALAAGADRTLAAPVLSSVDVPGHDNSAVDGYAVRTTDA